MTIAPFPARSSLRSKLPIAVLRRRTLPMFARMLLRAAVLRRRRAASALLAMIVAAAVATAMMNLYVDVQAKLRTEFRNYGANVVIVAKDGQSAARRRAGQSRIRSRRKDAGGSFLLCRRPHQRRTICSRRRHRLRPRPPVESLVEGEPLARARQTKPSSECAPLP